ncbi:MAG: hypothetical protein M3347_13005 [Armatimonadota bacterium]|nr:hypothetical protein [Armatimonadota bacterium]
MMSADTKDATSQPNEQPSQSGTVLTVTLTDDQINEFVTAAAQWIIELSAGLSKADDPEKVRRLIQSIAADIQTCAINEPVQIDTDITAQATVPDPCDFACLDCYPKCYTACRNLPEPVGTHAFCYPKYTGCKSRNCL